jgi:hypothetical protein
VDTAGGERGGWLLYAGTDIIYIYIYRRVYVCMYVCMYVYIYIYIYIYIYEQDKVYIGSLTLSVCMYLSILYVFIIGVYILRYIIKVYIVSLTLDCNTKKPVCCRRAGVRDVRTSS